METMGFMFALIPVIATVVVVMFIISSIQQNKPEHSGSFKQTFYTGITLMMLSMLVGSLIMILVTVSQNLVFPQAADYQQRYNTPPSLMLINEESGELKTVGAAYTCADDCQFTASDRVQYENWQSEYTNWRKNQEVDAFRQDLVGPLSFLIVALPLYFVFRRLMERGAKDEQAKSGKPTAVRSLYYYFLSFCGLAMVVISLGLLINTGLRSWLKTDPTETSEPMAVEEIDADRGVTSVIACAEQCDFTVAEVDQANDWLADYQANQDRGQSTAGRAQNDLATTVPIIIVSLPLFWYHFWRIRKETSDNKPSAPTTV